MNKEFTGKERIIAAIEGKTTDRVPMNLHYPTQDEFYERYIEMCYKTLDTFKDQWVTTLFSGPWTVVAYGFRGIEKLLFDTVDDPQFVHDMMNIACEYSKAYGDLLFETGVNLRIAETAASCSLISPKIYKEFVHPYLKGIIDYYKEKGARIGLHIFSKTEKTACLQTVCS